MKEDNNMFVVKYLDIINNHQRIELFYNIDKCGSFVDKLKSNKTCITNIYVYKAIPVTLEPIIKHVIERDE